MAVYMQDVVSCCSAAYHRVFYCTLNNNQTNKQLAGEYPHNLHRTSFSSFPDNYQGVSVKKLNQKKKKKKKKKIRAFVRKTA